MGISRRDFIGASLVNMLPNNNTSQRRQYVLTPRSEHYNLSVDFVPDGFFVLNPSPHPLYIANTSNYIPSISSYDHEVLPGISQVIPNNLNKNFTFNFQQSISYITNPKIIVVFFKNSGSPVVSIISKTPSKPIDYLGYVYSATISPSNFNLTVRSVPNNRYLILQKFSVVSPSTSGNLLFDLRITRPSGTTTIFASSMLLPQNDRVIDLDITIQPLSTIELLVQYISGASVFVLFNIFGSEYAI